LEVISGSPSAIQKDNGTPPPLIVTRPNSLCSISLCASTSTERESHQFRRRESLLVTPSSETITVRTSGESLKGADLSISVYYGMVATIPLGNVTIQRKLVSVEPTRRATDGALLLLCFSTIDYRRLTVTPAAAAAHMVCCMSGTTIT
jgi:hypothetical protein